MSLVNIDILDVNFFRSSCDSFDSCANTGSLSVISTCVDDDPLECVLDRGAAMSARELIFFLSFDMRSSCCTIILYKS